MTKRSNQKHTADTDDYRCCRFCVLWDRTVIDDDGDWGDCYRNGKGRDKHGRIKTPYNYHVPAEGNCVDRVPLTRLRGINAWD